MHVMNRATVNCARLVHFDEDSCGSVVHQIDKVLEAPKMVRFLLMFLSFSVFIFFNYFF